MEIHFCTLKGWQTKTVGNEAMALAYVNARSDVLASFYVSEHDDPDRPPIYSAEQAVTPHRYRGNQKWCTMCLLDRDHERHAVQTEQLGV